MKVDMSPEAVLSRLNTIGQLWELSVALMNSKSLEGAELRPPRWRFSMIQDSIRKVLVDDWDPIGVRGIPEAVDEYDAYIGRLYRILTGTRSAADLIDCLREIEMVEMGVKPGTAEQLRPIANKLLSLTVEDPNQGNSFDTRSDQKDT